MPRRPSVIVYDVNETLSDLTPLQDRFADLGAAGSLAAQWFAAVLRDGFALTVTETPAPFARVADSVLRTVLQGVPLDRDLDDAVAHVMTGFMDLAVHADVPDGVRALRDAGLRQVTLSNGSAGVAEALLGRAGLRDAFEAVLSVEDAPAWKPAREAYEHAASRCGVDVADLLLVAVHPWDLHGAARAGLATAWIDRTGAPWPEVFTPPTVTVRSLPELAAALPA